MTVGHFEYGLLLVLLALGDGADGRSVRKELERRTGRQVTHGAVYAVLARLEQRELVNSWFGQETPRRGGRRPKHYRITPLGADSLARAHAQLGRLADGLGDELARLTDRSGAKVSP